MPDGGVTPYLGRQALPSFHADPLTSLKYITKYTPCGKKRRPVVYFLLATSQMKEAHRIRRVNLLRNTEQKMANVQEWRTLANKELSSSRKKPSNRWKADGGRNCHQAAIHYGDPR
ncbi:hypothetical protein ACNKHK_18550 [Shigella flexneri]